MSALDIVKKADQLLNGKRLLAIVAGLIIILFTGLPQNIDKKYTIITLLFSGPIGIGSAIFFLNLIRGHEIRLEQLFDGFKLFVPSFLLTIFSAIAVILGLLCFIIPGIILALGLSFCSFIMADNPDLTPIEVMQKSWEMTNGYKMQLLLLAFVCIGLIVMGLFCFGVGIFYALPIIYCAQALFYEEVLDGNMQPDL